MALPRFETTYSVAELGREIRGLVAAAFESVWVAGEVQRARLSSAGHLYFELVEKGDGEGLAGRLDAVVWRGELAKVRPVLAATGQELTDGLLLRCRVTVDFYPPGGRLQLQVREVDPVFGLGELERRRRETIAALEAAGLAGRNRALPLPALPLAVGLVTSEGSAAYHDFLSTLAESGYPFRVAFVHAAVQGREAEREVAAALATLGRRPLDCIALVRGGGSRTDLAAFDSRAIAEAVALSPLPVVTGLGHEIDQSVADLVAHTAAKTPTKAAELLVERLRGAEVAFARLRDRLLREAGEPLARARRRLERAGRGLAAVRPRLERDAARLEGARRALLRALPARLRTARTALALAGGRLERGAARRLERARQEPRQLARRLADRAAARLALTAARLDGHRRLLAEIGPERVLARGFSITRREDGRLLRDAAEISPGSRLVTRLARGSVHSSVESTIQSRGEEP